MRVWEEPVRGGYADSSLWALPGLERMLAGVAGAWPIPPLGRLVGGDITDIGPGRATATMPATGWLRSPQGRIPIGVLAIVADVAFGCALVTELDAGVAFTTAELSLQRLRTPATTGVFRARGRTLFVEPPVGLVEVSIDDGDGTFVAHGTSRLTIFPPIDPLPPPPAELPVLPPDEHGTPDPWEREPPTTVLHADEWGQRSGAEIIAAQIAGELPPAPIHYLTGLRPVEIGDGTAVAALPASEWLNSGAGSVQGGVTAMLADTAMQMAIQSTVGRGDAFVPLDMKVNYLRPVASDGGELLARATVVHRGRQIRVATVEIVNAAGKPVAVATGSGRTVS